MAIFVALLLATGHTVHVGGGRAVRTFTLRRPAGVILLARIEARRGTRAYVDATIPGVAGTRVSTFATRPDPALSCRSAGSRTVCTQAEEWCPMPAARWRFRLVKLTGPAGDVLVDFVVGAP